MTEIQFTALAKLHYDEGVTIVSVDYEWNEGRLKVCYRDAGQNAHCIGINGIGVHRTYEDRHEMKAAV